MEQFEFLAVEFVEQRLVQQFVVEFDEFEQFVVAVVVQQQFVVEFLVVAEFVVQQQ